MKFFPLVFSLLAGGGPRREQRGCHAQAAERIEQHLIGVDAVWWLSVLFGILSAVINLPIVEKPVPRAAAAA
jgi:hypothetical protein